MLEYRDMRSIALAWKYAIISLLAFALACCEKADNQVPEPVPEIIEEQRLLMKANKFVYDYTTEAYLWRNSIPSNITYTSASNPVDLFEMMRNKELDIWSYVTDNSQEAMESFQGVSTTFGYSLAFGRFTNVPDIYFAVVEYVYPNSPAQAAGMKRGDIILTLDGANIKDSNYTQLYFGSTITLGLGTKNDSGGIGLSGVQVTITSVKMYEDPVVQYNIIETGEKKIGYLFYAGFYSDSHSKLANVFSWFQSEQITDLILDLRYNLGGDANTPPYLASMIAPESVVKKKSVFLTQTWNDLYMAYFRNIGEDMNTYFNPDIPVNLNLSKVYVITTGSTASASEATISGLSPYMDVVKIGQPTYGKYCGAALITPVDSNGKEDREISNWLLSLVIYKFVNIEGFTEFTDGIAPDYIASDDGLLYGIPLGDPNDPMIAKAVEVITGNGTKAPALNAPAGVEIVPYMVERPMRGGMNRLLEL